MIAFDSSTSVPLLPTLHSTVPRFPGSLSQLYHWHLSSPPSSHRTESYLFWKHQKDLLTGVCLPEVSIFRPPGCHAGTKALVLEDRKHLPQDKHIPRPRTCKYVPSCGRKGLGNCDSIEDLKRERLSWILQVSPEKHP